MCITVISLAYILYSLISYLSGKYFTTRFFPQVADKKKQANLGIVPDIGHLSSRKSQNSVLSNTTFDLPDILSGDKISVCCLIIHCFEHLYIPVYILAMNMYKYLI